MGIKIRTDTSKKSSKTNVHRKNEYKNGSSCNIKIRSALAKMNNNKTLNPESIVVLMQSYLDDFVFGKITDTIKRTI